MLRPLAGAPQLSLRPLLLDVGGTLLSPARPVDVTYLELGRPFGVEAVDFRGAWQRRDPGLQQTGDGRPFWRALVADATNCNDLTYFELLYGFYTRPEAWSVAPGGRALLGRHDRVALVSNWDSRLPATIEALGLRVAAIVASGEQGFEKPDPRMFLEACRRLGCAPSEAVHVGDSEIEDLQGARAAGIEAWLLGRDVRDLNELSVRLSVV